MNSFAKGILGIVLLTISAAILFTSLGVTFGATLISIVTDALPSSFINTLVGAGIIGTIVSAIGVLYGAKFVIENENKLLQLVIGILGIAFIITGISLLAGGSAGTGASAGAGTPITLPIAIAGLAIITLGIAFAVFGFKVKQGQQALAIISNAVRYLP